VSQPVAWSLAQMLMAALRDEAAPDKRERICLELGRMLTRLRPGQPDIPPKEARSALARCGLDPDYAAAKAIHSAAFKPRPRGTSAPEDSPKR